MIKDTYKDINPELASFVSKLIPKDDSYHKTHERRFLRTIQVLLDQEPKGKLLEIATSGLVPIVLKEFAPDLEVYVTELDEKKSSVVKKTFEFGGKQVEATTYQLDLEKHLIKEKPDTFDYVICCEVLEHMEIDPMAMLSEINRVIKPKGTLITTTPNAVSSLSITKMLNGIEPYFYMHYQVPPAYHRHNYEYSIHSLVSLLKSAGFDGKAWTENTFEDPVFHDVNKLKAIGYRMDHVGDNIFSVSRKISEVVNRYPKGVYDA
jgi:2-polyprenyl-3-methyl-5-hydroxy-6-metoxy-1,4-benzoquinol methylase